MTLEQKLRGLGSLRLLVSAVLRGRPPRRRTLAQRLAQLPLEGAPLEQPVTIRWNAQHVPQIEAATDRDCAVALGIVHAHLRLGQMEMMRRIAWGRTAEMVGPAGIELDHALRAFDLTRDIDGAIDRMSPETKSWLEGFAAGIRHVLETARELPPEFTILALQREPWTIRDIVAIGRLSGADVHWGIWLKLLRHRTGSGWVDIWDQLLTQGIAGPEQHAMQHGAFGNIIAGARSGSNSFAVTGAKTGTGNALIASDPHLPVTIPNIWLLCGFKSPSYDVVGLMLPALPFVALGRNAAIGFGGTNLHAASSDFVDLSLETQFTTRQVDIKVRGGETVTRTIRESRYGPVISDAPLLKAEGACFALRWAGHEATREFDAMLGFNRARNWDEFREAADGFGVPGQNFVYADREGHVGKLIAAWLPRRRQKPSASLLTSPETLAAWERPAVSRDLPQEYDPASGVIASANDEPPDAGFPVGFFYSTRDRARRIFAVLDRARPASVETMERLQRDVSSEPALALRDLILDLYDRSAHDRERSRYNRPVVVALRLWDGSYDADSAGALALELMKSLLMAGLHSATERAAFGSVWHARDLLYRSLAAGQKDRTARIVAKCIEHAVPPFRKYHVWGNIHRLRLRHPLGMLPVAGKRFQFGEWGAGGNGDTVMKTGAGSGMGPHGVSYGSIARHISDLSQPDHNWFCLLGGQDGWLGSDTVLDQVAWWREGKYLKVPMTPDAIARDFPFVTVVKPAATSG